MKNTEFIELINLYLDHELPPADCRQARGRGEAPTPTAVCDLRAILPDAESLQGRSPTDFAAEAPVASIEKILAPFALLARRAVRTRGFGLATLPSAPSQLPPRASRFGRAQPRKAGRRNDSNLVRCRRGDC